jgi:peptidoglycan/xylan/chitin deacetylase (PgdA/CDA1 family)
MNDEKDYKKELKELLRNRLDEPTVFTSDGIKELSEDDIWGCYSYVIREAISRNLPEALEMVEKENLKNETVFLLADYLKLKIDLKISELIAAPALAQMIEDIKHHHENFGDRL